MKRRPHVENAQFAFNSPPDVAQFFASGPFFEGKSTAGRLFHIFQLAFWRGGF